MKKGWEIKKLKEVCEKITDGTHQTPKYFSEGYLFLSSKNVTSGKINWNDVKYIDEKQHLEMHKRVAPRINDILLAKNGTTGVAALVDRDVTFDIYVSLAHLRPKEILNPFYLLHFINSPLAKDQFNKRLKGIGVPNLHLEEIREVEIPLPPLSIQQEIVSILEETFEALAQVKANAEQNLKNAKALFESFLQGVFENKGEGWDETILQKEIDLLTGFPFKSANYTEDKNDILLLRGDNIMQGNMRWEDVKRWKKSEYNEYEKYQMREDDIVLAMDRPWVKAGLKCAKLTQKDLPSLLVQRTATLRSKPNIDSTFLYYLVKSKRFTQHLLGVQTGSGVPHISSKDILSFSFCKPNIVKQQAIVKKLDALSTETKRLEAIYAQKLKDIEELKKAILEKAFKGELKRASVEV
jgi:type I restriction enzyme, S subunit